MKGAVAGLSGFYLLLCFTLGYEGWFWRGGMFAEMATNIYAHADAGLSAFAIADYGYIPYFPRWIGLWGEWLRVPDPWIPWFYNLTSMSLLMAFVLALLHPVFEPVLKLNRRCVLAVVLVFLPAFSEKLLINVSGLGFLFILLWMGLEIQRKPARFPLWIGFLMLVPLSKSYAVLLIPLVVYSMFRQPRYVLLRCLWLVLAVIQFIALVGARDIVRDTGFAQSQGLGASAQTFIGYVLAMPAQWGMGVSQVPWPLALKVFLGVLIWILAIRFARRQPLFWISLYGFGVCVALNCMALSAVWNPDFENLESPLVFYRHNSPILMSLLVALLAAGFRARFAILWLCFSGHLWQGFLEPVSGPFKVHTGTSLFAELIQTDAKCIPVDPPGWVYPASCKKESSLYSKGSFQPFDSMLLKPYRVHIVKAAAAKDLDVFLKLQNASGPSVKGALKVYHRDASQSICSVHLLPSSWMHGHCRRSDAEMVLLELSLPPEVRVWTSRKSRLPSVSYFFRGKDNQ